MSDSRALQVEGRRSVEADHGREVICRSRSHMLLALGLAALVLAGAACDRAGSGETQVASALVEDTPAAERAVAAEFLTQVARRRQIAAAQRASAAKQLAAEVVLQQGPTPTRNARLKAELESLAAAVDRRADEAQAAADYHLALAQVMEGGPDAGGPGGRAGSTGGAGGTGGASGGGAVGGRGAAAGQGGQP